MRTKQTKEAGNPFPEGTGLQLRITNTFVTDESRVRIPHWVADLSSFRHWVQSDEIPEKVRIGYLNGEVWVDMSKEQVFFHNQDKNEYGFVLTGLAKSGRPGQYFPDGLRVSNREANLSAQPNGTFVCDDSFDSGRVRLVPGARDGVVELEGSPDMVLEIVSWSSVHKDTVTLLDLYWRAGIREYWLVDVRGDRLVFEIYRHTAKGYVATRKQGGWVKSAVFGRSFRLVRQMDKRGNPAYTLAVRPEGNGKA